MERQVVVRCQRPPLDSDRLLLPCSAGLKFALPGKERQDSVFNGLQTIPDNAALVCVHDAARPLVSNEEVYNVSCEVHVFECEIPETVNTNDIILFYYQISRFLQTSQVIRDANEHGAAVLAVPMKATVKESADGQFVLQTIDRSRLWEIHTPQVLCMQFSV